MKIVADRDAAHPEPLHQDMVNEVLRRGLGPLLVEGHDHSAGKAGSRKQPQFGPFIGQAELGSVRAEIATRVRFEGQRQSRPAVCQPYFKRRCDD